jgi:hypothetical protein
LRLIGAFSGICASGGMAKSHALIQADARLTRIRVEFEKKRRSRSRAFISSLFLE